MAKEKKKRFIVCKGQKVRNVNDNGNIKIFQSGELLPEDYVVNESFIINKIVEEVTNG